MLVSGKQQIHTFELKLRLEGASPEKQREVSTQFPGVAIPAPGLGNN